MDTAKKIEHLKFIIGRYDHYFDTVNTKGNVYLSLNTFILGLCITAFNLLPTNLRNDQILKCLFVLIMLLCAASVGTTLLALKPYITPKSKSNKSIVYFGDVSHCGYEHYKKLFNEQTEADFLNDLTKQANLLACGLQNKFRFLSKATIVMGVKLLLIVVFGIILMNK